MQLKKFRRSIPSPASAPAASFTSAASQFASFIGKYLHTGKLRIAQFIPAQSEIPKQSDSSSHSQTQLPTRGAEIIDQMQPTRIHEAALGLDFGTTNSSLALLTPESGLQLASFPSLTGPLQSFRSVLYLEQARTGTGPRKTHSLTGPAAIEHYLQADEKGRLIQSLKSHLSSWTLTGTEVFGRRYKLEDLISRMLTDLRKHAEAQFQRPIRYAMVGRPVRFVGADTPEDDDFAISRLRLAFNAAGFEHVDFEMEPVAAACAYEATLDHDELILIGDFGGGTSDFSLLRVGPGIRRRGRTPTRFARQ